MARAKRGVKRRQRVNKIREAASGFVLGQGTQYKRMIEAVRRSWSYAYRDRRVRKRDFRSLWIGRITAAAQENETSYSRLIHSLTKSNVELNRKMLSEIAIADPTGFKAIVSETRSSDTAS